MGSHCLLPNLADMGRKPSAGFGLCVDRVPIAYHWVKTSREGGNARGTPLIHSLTFYSLSIFFLSPLPLSLLVVLVLTVTIMVTVT
jgi:hypothetical protein